MILERIVSRRTISATILALLLIPPTALAGSGVQYSRDKKSTLISKDVGTERWAITYRLADGAVFGNVFYPDGREPSFVSCDRSSSNGGSATFRCYGADRCGGEPCPPGQYSFIADVTLPESFFLPPGN